MTTQEIDAVSEARVFAIAAPLILPMIEKRRRVAYESLIRDHKQGRTENTALVATLAVLYDLEQDIKQKEAHYNHLMEKQNVRNT